VVSLQPAKQFPGQRDIVASNPEEPAELKTESDAQAKAYHVYPIGAGLYLPRPVGANFQQSARMAFQ
jgi:hypothetical protein